MTVEIRSESVQASRQPPLVSIVINNYNYARFLPQSIDSALAQSYPRTEVIVVDDASTDDSRTVIAAYQNRIKAVLQAENAGQGAAMNAGLAASSGDIIIFLDADDYLYPDVGESVARLFRPKVALIQYRLHLVDIDGSIIDLYPRPEVRFDTGDVRSKLVDRGRFEGTVTSGLALSRSALIAVAPIPVDRFRISADGYLLSTVPFHGDVLAIDRPLGAYRLHGGNLWSSTSSIAAGFKRALLHDAIKYREVVSQACSAGMRVSTNLGLRDYQHVSARIGSLILAPAVHPVAGDSRVVLALHGATSIRSASLRLKMRALLGLWFIGVGTLPMPLARRLVNWRFDSCSRPPALRNTLKALRGRSGR